MAVRLLMLIPSVHAPDDRETKLAFLRTKVPHLGKLAYLHIVYKPAPEPLLSEVARRLRMPQSVTEFLATQNGACLFSGAIHIFGVVKPGTLLNRSDPDSLPPLNIEWQNSADACFDADRFLAVGSYGFDGSVICVDRQNGWVNLFAANGHGRGISWPSLDKWITSEVARLSLLFDANGKTLVDESATVPVTDRSFQ